MENCINLVGSAGVALVDTRKKRGIGIRKAGDAVVLASLLLGLELVSAFDASSVSSMSESIRSEKIVENASDREFLKLNLGVHAHIEETPDLLEIAASIEATKCSSKKLQTKETLEDGQTVVSAEEFVGIMGPKADVPEAIVPEVIVAEAEYVESVSSDVEISKDDIVTENSVASDGNTFLEDVPISEENKVTEDVDKIDGNSIPEFVVVPDEDRVMDSESDGMDDADDAAEEEIMPGNGFLIDKAGMIYGIDKEAFKVTDGYLQLPAEGCVGIKREAFSEISAEIVEIYIPPNISIIEEGVFSDLSLLEWIEVESGNTGYKSIDGVLFDGSGTTLLSFPGGRTDSYAVPEGVVRIAEGAFANTALSCLDLWRCNLAEIGANIFGSHNGNGIKLIAPAESIDWYQNLFAGYDVWIS